MKSLLFIINVVIRHLLLFSLHLKYGDTKLCYLNTQCTIIEAL